jgi:thiamine biosynthesis lipoprotein
MVLARTATIVLALAVVWSFPSRAATPPLEHYEATRLSMGCVYAIEAYGHDVRSLTATVRDAFDEIDRLDRLMSHYQPQSPLSRINREAARAPMSVEPELFDFIAAAMRYTRQSDGAFDITVGPLMKAWGFFGGDGHMPSTATLAEARRHVGPGHVILDSRAQTIRFDEPGVELDLGGVAKGYAVDRAVRILRAAGVSGALVSAGGSTIYALGTPPLSDSWELSVQDPVDSRRTARTIRLSDRALSIAGSSEKSFEADGVRYSHIMDPRTGRPVQGVLSVAVVAPSGTAGDALDDALFVLGPTRSRDYLGQWPAVEAMFFMPAADGSWTVVQEGHR